MDIQTLHQKISSIAAKYPEKTAIEMGKEKVFYSEFDQRTDQIANFLYPRISKEEKKNISILLGNSIELVTAIVGVLKSGGVFVPIDPTFPQNRILYMVNKINSNWIITKEEYLDKVNQMLGKEERKINALVLGSATGENKEGKYQNINIYSIAESLLTEELNLPNDIVNKDCYIYFTSGSTGKPKAILGKHRSLKHFIDWEIKEFGLDESYRVSQITSPSFDPYLRDIFVPLSIGGTICIPETREIVFDPQELKEWIDRSRINLIHIIPTLFKALLEIIDDPNCFRELKYILSAGEMLRGNDIRKFFELFEERIQLINLYGPTETTLAKLFYRVRKEDVKLVSVPVGKAIDGAQVMVLDENLNPCAPDSVGEIYIRTPYTSGGYYNDPEATRKAFIQNPFNDNPRDRIYKTGDLGMISANGIVEIVGRADNQIKIRGVRIQPGEIEYQLLEHAEVKEAVVAVTEIAGSDAALFAYLVATTQLDSDELRTFLTERLPEYMIPTYFIQLEKMPLTPNGKIDRKALPAPHSDLESEYVPPTTDLQRELVSIWSEVLNIENIGVKHNFFKLGGNSLKATILSNKLYRRFSIKVPLEVIFKNPTIEGMSGYIEKAVSVSYDSIKKAAQKEYYEASSAQKRMFLLQKYDLNNTGYNITATLKIKGRLELKLIEKALTGLIDRHETLRTSFEIIDGKIVQKIHDNCQFQVEYLEKEGQCNGDIIKDFVRPFDLSKAPLFRVGIIKLSKEEYIIIFDIHHIISDGLSMGILFDEFSRLYAGQVLDNLRLQYKDYSEWQNSQFETEGMHLQEEYWINRLSSDLPVLELPLDYPRPNLQSFTGDSFSIKINTKLRKDLEQLTRKTGSTMYMVLMSAVNILLAQYSGQEDIIIGSPITGRSHPDLERLIGMFVNTLVMRNRPVGSKSFLDFLEEVKNNTVEAFKNQDYPFEKLVQELNIKRESNRHPLFDVMFVMQNFEEMDLKFGNLEITGLERYNDTSKFDLAFIVQELKEELIFELSYNTDIFKRSTVERMARQFLNILEKITNNNEITLNQIELITDEEKYQILFQFNDTAVDYPSDKTIHQLFEEQAAKNPDKMAVVHENICLTYKELNQRANRLARILQGSGVKEEKLVGIAAERSVETIVGILAILKAGGAYVPIDPKYPVERISYILEDSSCQVLLTQTWLKERIPADFKGEILYLDNVLKAILKTAPGVGETDNLEQIASPDNLCYVIYTSGSTGKPKGVLVENRGLTNYVWWAKEYYCQDCEGNFPLYSSLSFDLTVTSIFVPLVKGSTIYIIGNEGENLISEAIKQENVNIVKLTPAHLALIKDEDNSHFSVKKFILGGEDLKSKLAKAAIDSFGGNLEIYNEYGPTETVVGCSVYKYNPEDKHSSVLIGKPIANTQIYILDKYLKPVPPGVVGEIYISGDGVARGYLNRPELTSEKFMDNPFIPDKRMYKSGDLGRYLPDGNIEFLGRVDNQVKIRGYRIEIGEVEAHFLKHPDIKEGVVDVKTDESGNKYLIGYFVSEKNLTVGELRSYLLEQIPEYMVPSYFVQLEKMPLNTNGKIDRKKLLELEYKKLNTAGYTAPENKLEEKLVALFEEVLGIEKVGTNDNFFELGGHSLKATLLTNKIHKELNKEILLTQIFKWPTVKELAQYISNLDKSPFSPIEPVEEREYYPVSSAQKRLYILEQTTDIGVSYNMPRALLVEGNLNRDRLNLCVQKLVKRHETLRTSFHMRGGEIVQKVNPEVKLQISYLNIKGDEIDQIIKDFIRPFDLEKVPLFRVGLVELEKEKYLLLFDMHHIISDATSLDILTRDFANLYKGKELAKLPIQFKDFTIWQNKVLTSDSIREQKEYWLKKFAGEIPVLNMPTDYPRPPKQTFIGKRISFTADAELTSKLHKLAKENSATLYMVLLAAYNVILARYSGQEDIIVGSPSAGRSHSDVQGIIGMFVNTLAMHNYPEGTLSFKEFLQNVKHTALEAYENQDFQFEQLVESLEIPTDLSRNPLFDTLFALQNTDISDFSIEGLHFTDYPIENNKCNFDLTLVAQEYDDRIIFELVYCANLYKEEMMQKFTEHFLQIIRNITENPEVSISSLEMITPEEKHQILEEFNGGKEEYPLELTFIDLFEEQVELRPSKTALVFGNKNLTYQELNIRSNCLAHQLKEKGVAPETIVAVLADNSPEMIISVMAILKAGGAYLPIDLKYPLNRVQYILSDSNVEILLTQNANLNKEEIGFAGEVIVISDKIEDQEMCLCRPEAGYDYYNPKYDYYNPIDYSNPAKVVSPFDLAYVIYTSGSTGNPKGVMVEHHSLTNLILWFKNYFNMTSEDRCSKYAGFGFDASVGEIFTALSVGATLYLIDEEIKLDIKRLNEYFQTNDISFSFLPTQFCEQFMKYENNSLRVLITAGDELKRFVKQNYQLYNGYGPTEGTMCTTMFPVDQGYHHIPIGKPIGNVQVYILDQKGNLQPIGVPGELCIGGEGVARGYLHRPDLTAEKFVPNPFKPGERLYRSGDLARWLNDGNLEFLGRIDDQVQIRGFRVETGEIKRRLLEHSKVLDAVVLVREKTAGDKYLCAYLVTQDKISITELRNYLAEELPDYMIPAYFVEVDQIPTNANGKVNKKALPEPDDSLVSGTEYVAPVTRIEDKLVAIWSEELQVDGIGVNHDFFELGGHSLKAMNIISRIHKELDVELPLKVIFAHPTIKELANYIQNSDKESYISIEPVEEREYYPVSSAQKRSFVLNQLDKTSVGYNIPIILWIKGKIIKEKLEESFKKLIARHETLRTSFQAIDGKIVQKVHPEVEFTIKCQQAKEDELDGIIEEFVKPFNLKKAPLVRVGLVEVSRDRHLLLFDMHHIISDALSIGILTEDITKLYLDQNLPPLNVQYRDYSVWQNQLITSGAFGNQEKYWLERFAGSVPVLELFTDYPRPSRQSFEGSVISFEVDSVLRDDLYRLARNNSATLYMILLASYNVLLSKYSRQEDIVIGSPIAGRTHNDVQGLIGMFINTLAMRNYPGKNKTFKEFLKEVKENSLMAYENQDYQFEQLVEKLELTRDASRNPLFDCMLILQNAKSSHLAIQDLEFENYPYTNHVSKVDLTLNASEFDEKIFCSLEYCTGLFKETTVERMSRHFINILKQVSKEPDILLKDIDLLTDTEKNQILYEFNNTSTDFTADRTIHQLFTEQARKTPEKIALVFGEEELTYRELDEKSSQLATLLNQRGARPGTFCAVMVERSLAMLISILGILKSGAAYLPIDPDYPIKRIKYVLEDSQAEMILTEGKFAKLLTDFAIDIIDVNEALESVGSNTGNISETCSGPTDLAYIIYTSGSTGLPKGVVVEHRALNNFIKGITDIIDFDQEKTILALTTISFDIFGLETLLPLTQGTRVVIASEDDQKDPRAFARLIAKQSIDMLQLTPSRAKLLLKVLKDQQNQSCLKGVKEIMIGGEAFPSDLLREVKDLTDARIYNMYGPTETTIWSSVKDLTDEEEITIGKPIANTQMYIVSDSNQLQPIGVPGELWIAGEGLARGYWRRDELTAEKFVANLFTDKSQNLGREDKAYRTGDLARWLENGEIQFLGRIDNQVKVRGYRIEPGEVERKIISHEKILETVVVDGKDTRGESYLAAYIVTDAYLEVSALKEELSKELPQYMIPVYFIQLDQMPLTPNGKIDRKMLPAPNANLISGTEYVAPTNEIEEKLVRFWEEVLGIEGIGIHHNFFDIGGNSVNIIEIINKIRREFIIEVPMGELFLRPTIAELANNLFLDNPLNGLECIISLNKPTEGKKNIFIVHNWQGLIYQYKELAKLLEGEYNVYGIQARGVMGPAPLPETAKEMLTEYIVEMKKIQPEGPYIISGYCYGNWLAYKMVQMLEYQGVPVEKMIMIDEMVLLSDFMIKYLRARTLVSKPYRWVKKIFNIVTKGKNYNPMDYWPDIEEFRRKKKKTVDTKNERTVRENIEYLSTRKLNIKHIVSTDTLIIKAEETDAPRFTREDWQQVCDGEVEFIEIRGDHHGIFNPPYVEQIADLFRKTLE